MGKIQSEQKRIAIFFGGDSTEYGVSLQSASAVIKAINREDYQLVLIGIEPGSGTWFWYQGDEENIEKNCWCSMETCTRIYPAMDKSVHGFCYYKEGLFHEFSIDAAFPILHGKNGEDGTVQGVLELMGVPVIGCGVLSSAVCMDKVLSHQIVKAAGIKTADYRMVPREASKDAVRELAAEIGYPLFVKPVRAGSSFGITKVQGENELPDAVEEAFTHDTMVILEEAVDGFEVGCAVLGTRKLLIGEVDEIELSDGFFDFTEKYTLKTSSIHVPARISKEKAEEIKKAALQIYRLLGCSHFARVDMFLTGAGEIYFNEVNTIPGFTAHSRYPNMLKAAGFPFEEVISRLLKMEE